MCDMFFSQHFFSEERTVHMNTVALPKKKKNTGGEVVKGHGREPGKYVYG